MTVVRKPRFERLRKEIMKPRQQTRNTTRRTTRATRSPGKQPTDIRGEISNWLRDAYAMERGLERALQKQANNGDLSSDVRDRAATHLEETRRHAEEIKVALQSLGTDTSSMKTGIGLAVEASKGMATKFARDEEIKDLLDAYAMEHFEIACYTALIAAAERAGLAEIAETCRRILRDEERMAQRLKQSLPDEVAAYLFTAEAAQA